MQRREAFLAGLWGALGVAVAALSLYLGYNLLHAAAAVSTPFVAALVIALLCDPLVTLIQKNVGLTKGRRAPAVALVFVLFLMTFVALITLVVPSLITQIENLITWLTNNGLTQLQTGANDWLTKHPHIGPITLPLSIDGLVNQLSDQAKTVVKQVGPRVLSLVAGSLSGALNVILIPLLTFFLLMDLGRLRQRLIFLLPTQLRSLFVGAASDVGEVFSNYLRGMMQVSLGYMVVATLLFTLLAVALAPKMLAYVLLIGIVSGALYVVPYIGLLGAIITAVAVAVVSGAGIPVIIACIAIPAVLNFTFDSVVTPRIVGSEVGVHPILGMFALLMGATLFGLWGMLLAYPAAGSVQVVLFRLFPKLAQPTPLLRTAVEPAVTQPDKAD